MSHRPPTDASRELDAALRAMLGEVPPHEEAWYAQFRTHLTQRESIESTDIAAGIAAIRQATLESGVVRPSSHFQGTNTAQRKTRTPIFPWVVSLMLCAVISFGLGVRTGQSKTSGMAVIATSRAMIADVTKATLESIHGPSSSALPSRSLTDTSSKRYSSEKPSPNFAHSALDAIKVVIITVKQSITPFDSSLEKHHTNSRSRHLYASTSAF